MQPIPGLQRIEIAPNCSLSARGALFFFSSLFLVTFAVATLMAARGFWPVLPFAGLEMAVLGWALNVSLRRRHHRETIIVSDADVRVESRDRSHYVEVVFPRHWARVKLRRPQSPLHPSCLTIESHGRRCEVGSFLTEQERRGLAQRLTRLIGRVDESPSLA
ncbi:MAG TPA: DUF2244 domain-containing protein [Steroidobacteraceae bacterium]|nr:DUF2244 domain-containing protein [Steroidobacteraceae bacterium]